MSAEKRYQNLVIATGKEEFKLVGSFYLRSTPFVGASAHCGGELYEFGVGITCSDIKKGAFWGLVHPHMLIQSWRAMRILENIEEIDVNSTLAQAWAAGARESDGWKQEDTTKLAAKVGEDKFNLFRAKILNEVPAPDELAIMLRGIIDNRVEIATWELKKEIEEGRLAPHPLIDEVIAEEKRRAKDRKRAEEESKKPLPPDQSFTHLFRQLGITTMAEPNDWAYSPVEIDEYEAHMRKAGVYWQNKGLKLVMCDPHSDRVVTPSVTLPDGTGFTFPKANFVDKTFSVLAKIEPKDGEPHEDCYTIPELRLMLEPLLFGQQNFISRVMNQFRSR